MGLCKGMKTNLEAIVLSKGSSLIGFTYENDDRVCATEKRVARSLPLRDERGKAVMKDLLIDANFVGHL